MKRIKKKVSHKLSVKDHPTVPLDHVLERAAVGRSGYLGDLYNAYEEQFCGGQSIFKQQIPNSLIREQDKDFSDIQYLHSDDISEKFKHLEVTGELKVGILCGLFKLGGSGKYFKHSKTSQRTVGMGLLYHVETKVQEIDMSNKKLPKYINDLSLRHNNASHVVQRITWGANVIVLFETTCMKEDASRDIELNLKSKVTNLANKFGFNKETKIGRDFQDLELDCKLKIYADVLPEDTIPNNISDVAKFIEDIPLLIQKCNNGLGKPLHFTLVPLSEVHRLVQGSRESISSVIMRQLDEGLVEEITNSFSELQILKAKLNDHREYVNKYQLCLPNTILEDIDAQLKQLYSMEISLKNKLKLELVDYRHGKSINFSIKEFKDFNIFKNWLSRQNLIKEKIQIFETIRSKCTFVGRDGSLDIEVFNTPEAYVLFLSFNFLESESNRSKFFEKLNIFTKLINNIPAKFILCDLDLCQYKNITSTQIWKFENGVVVSQDYGQRKVSVNLVLKQNKNSKCCDSVCACCQRNDQEDDEVVNIMVVGQSGLTESTWLNTINYVTHSSSGIADRKCITPTKLGTAVDEEFIIIRRRKMSAYQ